LHGIAQARGDDGVLPFAQRRSSNPARISIVMPGLDPAIHHYEKAGLSDQVRQ
jgi:hypothetical protein